MNWFSSIMQQFKSKESENLYLYIKSGLADKDMYFRLRGENYDFFVTVPIDLIDDNLFMGFDQKRSKEITEQVPTQKEMEIIRKNIDSILDFYRLCDKTTYDYIFNRFFTKNDMVISSYIEDNTDFFKHIDDDDLFFLVKRKKV